MRLLEVADDITRAVARRDQLDLKAFEYWRAGMAIDAAKGRVLARLQPTSAVNARQVSWHDTVEAFANLDMKWSVAR